MKRILSILTMVVIMLSFTQSADAYGWRGWHHGWGWGYRPYYGPPVVAPYAPGPYYAPRPYYAPAPIVRGPWIGPHWGRGPYAGRWIPGHYARR